MRVGLILGPMLGLALAQENLFVRFSEWKAAHGKLYGSPQEENHRFLNWLQSYHEIQAHNKAGHHSYRQGLNKFADLTWEEFKQNKLGASQNCSATHVSSRQKDGQDYARGGDRAGPLGLRVHRQPPDSIDWRDKGAVSQVKDQGQCGSCWTFSSTGALESHHFLQHGEMKLFSEQQLVDCAQAFDNNGCRGGLPSHAFQYLRYEGGIETEEAYPYQARDQRCAFDPSQVAGKVRRAWNITFQDEDELKWAVALHGPTSVAFQVAADLRLYEGGVYSSHVCRDGPQDVNHAVLAVGYGTDERGKDYWLIKNSWSTEWGEDGYFRIERGVNMCGIADCASFPIMY